MGGIQFAEGQFFVVADDALLSSPDGRNWTRVGRAPSSLVGLSQGPEIAAVGWGGTLLRKAANAPRVPVIVGSTELAVGEGEPFHYTASALHDVDSYHAYGLPGGLVLDAQSGEISGELSEPGVHEILLGAKNSHGFADTRVLRVEVFAADGMLPFLPQGQVGIGGQVGELLSGSSLNRFYIQNLDVTSAVTISEESPGVGFELIAEGWRGRPETAGRFSIPLEVSNFYGVSETTVELVVPEQNVWEIHDSGTVETLNAVASARGGFLAVGADGGILSSSDGVEWQTVRSADGTELRALAASPGKWVAVGDGGMIVTSEDGLVWSSPVASGTTSAIHDVTYGGGWMLAVTADGRALFSHDGLEWTSSGVISPGAFSRASDPAALTTAAYLNGVYFVAGEEGNVYASADREEWNQVLHLVGAVERLFSYDGQLLAATSETLHSSSTGTRGWTQRDNPGWNGGVDFRIWGRTLGGGGRPGADAFPDRRLDARHCWSFRSWGGRPAVFLPTGRRPERGGIRGLRSSRRFGVRSSDGFDLRGAGGDRLR